MNNSIYILFLIIISLLIIFITKEIKTKKPSSNDNFENYQYYLSLLFDQMYNDAYKNKKQCSIEKSIIDNNKENLEKYLYKIKQYKYTNPELIIINKDQCLKYKGKNEYSVENYKDSSFCQDIWRQINNNIGFFLEYRLIKTYLNKNTIFLYKRYNCGEGSTKIVLGLSFKQK